jgi:hypothetical protein
MKINKLKESLNNKRVLIDELNLSLSKFDTDHQFRSGISSKTPLSKKQISTLTIQLQKWNQAKNSNHKQEQIAIESSIISELKPKYEQGKSNNQNIKTSKPSNLPSEVPTITVEKKFNNIKSFRELMQQESFSSPFFKSKNKTKEEIRSKVSDITNNGDTAKKTTEKPIEEANPSKASTPKGQPYKPDRSNIAALKAEISNKMRELDDVFKQDVQTVVTKSEEVKQMLERLNYLLLRESRRTIKRK